MSALNEIFGNVIYSEVKHLFDEMESVFVSLTENYSLELSEELSDTELYQIIESSLSKWNEDIYMRADEWEKYFEMARNVCSAIQNTVNPEDFEMVQKVNEGLRPLLVWLYQNNTDYSYVWLLYHFQRMTQFKKIAELYSKDAGKEVMTWRHLFEEGLKKEYKVNPDNYLSRIFDLSESNSYHYHGLSFLLIQQQTTIFGFIRKANINWEQRRRTAKTREYQLSENLKYAALAYRKKRVKGFPVETLDKYKIHYPKYKGKDIDGVFHLQGNLNGFIGIRRNKAHTIIVGFSGTEPKSPCNWKTDFMQYVGFLDPTYEQASGLLNSVWRSKRRSDEYKDSPIVVCGHSLGGGLMQYAIAKLDMKDIKGYGYNSAGLSKKNIELLPGNDYNNICHLYLPCDVVFKLPFAYQLGISVKMDTKVRNPIKAHFIEVMRANLKDKKHRCGVATI